VVTRGMIDDMKLFRVKTMRLSPIEEQYVKKRKCKKNKDTKYPCFGLTDTDFDGEQRSQCLHCMKLLAADSMKPSKLKRHFETVHAECALTEHHSIKAYWGSGVIAPRILDLFTKGR
jgi:hypothetical protein